MKIMFSLVQVNWQTNASLYLHLDLFSSDESDVLLKVMQGSLSSASIE